MNSENLDLEFLLRAKRKKDDPGPSQDFDQSGNGNHTDDDDLSFLLSDEPLPLEPSKDDPDAASDGSADLSEAEENGDGDQFQFDINDDALFTPEENSDTADDSQLAPEPEFPDLEDDDAFDLNISSLEPEDSDGPALDVSEVQQGEEQPDSPPEEWNADGWFASLSEAVEGTESSPEADTEADLDSDTDSPPDSSATDDAQIELEGTQETAAQPIEEIEEAPESKPAAPKIVDVEKDSGGDAEAPYEIDPSLLKKAKRDASFSVVDLFDTGSLLGLDIGEHAFKYVHLKKTGRGLKLLNCGSYAVPTPPVDESDEERKQRIAGVLQKKFKNKKFRNEIIVSVVSGMDVLFQNVQVPKMGKKELEKAVPWACRKDFPFPIEETVIEYVKLENKASQGGKLDMFVVAAQKNAVANRLDVLKRARITPDKITTVPSALWILFRTLKRKEANQCHGLIDIGSGSSHIAFVNAGELQFAREVSTGSDHFTQSLAGSIFVDGKEIDLSEEQAEALKRLHGFPQASEGGKTEDGIPMQEIRVMMGPVLERLVSEIKRTRDFFEERFRVEKVNGFYITGGGALMANLSELLEQELDGPVQVFNPFEHISLKKFGDRQSLLDMGPRFAVAAGLALDRKSDLNLLPDKMKSSGVLRVLKQLSGYILMILVLMMALLYQGVNREIKQVQNKFKQAREDYLAAKPMRDQFLALQKELTQLRNLEQMYDTTLEVDLSAADHMKAISNLFPRNIVLTSFRISYRKVKLEDDSYMTQDFLLLDGIAFESNSMEGINLAKFLLDLEKSQYFSVLTLRTQTIREDGSLSFTIECVL